MNERSVNLADLFEAVADTLPGRTAVVTSEGCCHSYPELDGRANRTAHVLVDIGVNHADRVAVIFHSRTEWVELILGCFKLDAQFVNMDYRYTAAETGHALADSELSVFGRRSEFPARSRGVQARATAALAGTHPRRCGRKQSRRRYASQHS